VWDKLRQCMAWQYPFTAATRQPAKTSVSALRRQAEQIDDEASAGSLGFRVSGFELTRNSKRETRNSSPVEVGTAHHRFLQFASLDRLGSAEDLRQEAQRMEREQVLSPEEIALLDFDALAAFWQSEFGLQVRTQAQQVRRELAFTARFSAKELAELTGEAADASLGGEFVVVQGVADLAVILPKEIWLADFKTDEVKRSELAAKTKLYEPQLKLYARALARIYRRPVTDCRLHFLALQTTVPVSVDGPDEI